MITYQVERVSDVLLEIPEDMFYKHFKEVDYFKDDMELEPDFSYYFALEEKGAIRPVIVRDNGTIIGYCVSFLRNHPHHIGKIFASNDIFYLHPEYRGSGIAAEMLAFVEKDLIGLGVSVISLGMKEKRQFKSLVEEAGYSFQEIRYCKYIGEE